MPSRASVSFASGLLTQFENRWSVRVGMPAGEPWSVQAGRVARELELGEAELLLLQRHVQGRGDHDQPVAVPLGRLPELEVEGTETVREYAAQAGFAGFEVTPVENDFWRFYLLTP